MRVLAMLHLYTPQHNAGAETTAHQLLKALVRGGHHASVQLSQVHPMFDTGPYTYEGVNVFPYRDQADPLRWIESDQPPDLIVSHLENTIRASILGKMHGIPSVALMHNNHGKSKADLRWGAGLVVYNTEWMRADVETWWADTQGDTPPWGIVVRPPIYPAEYRVTPPSAAAGYITLINLSDEKGQGVFYALAERFPKLRFLGVCGAYAEQVVRRDLPNVTIVPHVHPEEMGAEVYARTRVLLMPSEYESYGRAGVEAACSGIPTIAHPTPGLLESLGAGGIVVDRDDVDAWADELQRLTARKAWVTASLNTAGIRDRLTTGEDLARWVDAAETIARAPVPVG